MIKDFLINEQIKASEVRVVSASGEQLGVMNLKDAKNIASSSDLDLVLISPQAIPPVVKIIDYGKFKFETIKKEKENRKNQTVVEVKEVQLSATIDVGDINIKAKNAIRFLKDENRVKISLRMRGREQSRPEISLEVVRNFIALLSEYGVVEKAPNAEGRNITAYISPLKK